MELIYSMRRKPLKCEPPHFENVSDQEVIRPICTISSCNIIAFTSTTELSDADGDTWGGHVYVCDLDTPWDSHKVTSTSNPISVLEWDGEGKQLLVGTTVGDVSIFGQKDYLLNEWTCLYTASFPGEHIIKAVFFHNGRRVISIDKKLDAPMTDRIQMLRATPTLKGFGGVACEGACVITATGLVGALTPPQAPDSNRALTATDTLRAHRDHITHASFAHKNGSVLIAAVQHGSRLCVRCALCTVSRAHTAPLTPNPAPKRALALLAIQPLPSLYLPEGMMPTSITWSLREDTDSLLIAGATLTLWKLTERAHPVHKLLVKGKMAAGAQGSTTPGGGPKPGGDCFNTVVWQQVAAWPVEGSGGHVASSKLPLGAPHAVLATPRALHLLSRDNHHYICSRPVVTSGSPGSSVEAPSTTGTPPKKPKYGAGVLPAGAACAVVSCADISYLGGVVVAVDSHSQLHVYKLTQPWQDIPAALSVQHATNLLEYSLVSGYDCLDILSTLKPNIVEPVYERLTETFQRQPQTFQQYYYHSWLKLRIALCRLLPSLSRSCSWLSCLQMCVAAWSACAGALRPDDRPDAAPLAALLDEHADRDHDKALIALEGKTEVSSETIVLQALRRPLQRVVDIAITALASVPHHQPHGYELWTDPSAIMLLRKLLVVCRGVCGDVTISRLLARLHQTAAPKPDLLEECAALSAQMCSPRVWEALPRCCVSAPHGRPPPLYFEYGVEPDLLRYAPEPPTSAQCDVAPSVTMDSIRYMYLGGGSAPARARACGRCGARALPHAYPAKHPLQRAYDGRFLPACRCGGKWTLVSNI